MSEISRTNSLLADLQWLISQLTTEPAQAKSAIEHSVVLMFDQILLSYLCEIEDLKNSPDGVFSALSFKDATQSENWLVIQFLNDTIESGHWLHSWRIEREGLLLDSISSSDLDQTKSSSIQLVSIDTNDEKFKYKNWLNSFVQMLDQMRELNNQY
jgi:hypothetical protein